MGTGTGLGRVRGLGSAKHGATTWWHERLSSAASLLLVIWLVTSLLRLPSLDHQSVVLWLKSPLAAVPMLLFIWTVFWHLQMGLRVIVEDYVHTEANKILLLVLINFAALGGGALAAFSVLKIAFGGVAANG